MLVSRLRSSSSSRFAFAFFGVVFVFSLRGVLLRAYVCVSAYAWILRAGGAIVRRVGCVHARRMHTALLVFCAGGRWGCICSGVVRVARAVWMTSPNAISSPACVWAATRLRLPRLSGIISFFLAADLLRRCFVWLACEGCRVCGGCRALVRRRRLRGGRASSSAETDSRWSRLCGGPVDDEPAILVGWRKAALAAVPGIPRVTFVGVSVDFAPGWWLFIARGSGQVRALARLADNEDCTAHHLYERRQLWFLTFPFLRACVWRAPFHTHVGSSRSGVARAWPGGRTQSVYRARWCCSSSAETDAATFFVFVVFFCFLLLLLFIRVGMDAVWMTSPKAKAIRVPRLCPTRASWVGAGARKQCFCFVAAGVAVRLRWISRLAALSDSFPSRPWNEMRLSSRWAELILCPRSPQLCAFSIIGPPFLFVLVSFPSLLPSFTLSAFALHTLTH
ncbi:hypothetical protein B0H16DRAFT_1540144 [Mycena metata]|uniref:Uncharacterized protein n=1 Tax=Mycena metata TaxID=1033252 RepID=A0AAD7J762_9AGAR|nr:hypothetical protein B0H16DRAFT_1540144 [Mycena metata]